jgi:hypothetical protein
MAYRYTHYVRPDNHAVPIKLALTGSGKTALYRCRSQWARGLYSMIKANEAGKVSNLAVASRLAELNYYSHLNTKDGSVGPRSIVVWTRRRHTRLDGGGHEYFSKTTRETESEEDLSAIHHIANGTDLSAILPVIMKFALPWLEASLDAGGELEAEPPPPIDNDALNAELEKLDHEPDDRLK